MEAVSGGEKGRERVLRRNWGVFLRKEGNFLKRIQHESSRGRNRRIHYWPLISLFSSHVSLPVRFFLHVEWLTVSLSFLLIVIWFSFSILSSSFSSLFVFLYFTFLKSLTEKSFSDESLIQDRKERIENKASSTHSQPQSREALLLDHNNVRASRQILPKYWYQKSVRHSILWEREREFTLPWSSLLLLSSGVSVWESMYVSLPILRLSRERENLTSEIHTKRHWHGQTKVNSSTQASFTRTDAIPNHLWTENEFLLVFLVPYLLTVCLADLSTLVRIPILLHQSSFEGSNVHTWRFSGKFLLSAGRSPLPRRWNVKRNGNAQSIRGREMRMDVLWEVLSLYDFEEEEERLWHVSLFQASSVLPLVMEEAERRVMKSGA